MSRPSEFTQAVADAICELVADGKSLRTICAEEAMPNRATVFRWLAANETFRDQYARAREEQADAYADEIVGIADDGSNDYIEGENGPILNSEHIQRSRLRVDTRKWIASKLKPKKYGDKLELASDPERPVVPPIIQVVGIEPKKPSQ